LVAVVQQRVLVVLHHHLVVLVLRQYQLQAVVVAEVGTLQDLPVVLAEVQVVMLQAVQEQAQRVILVVIHL
jgi:hypothetical protein